MRLPLRQPVRRPIRISLLSGSHLAGVVPPSGGGGGYIPPNDARLVRLNTIYFPDTAVAGDVLTDMTMIPTGATVTIGTEEGFANAFTISGTQIRAGSGYAAIPCETIVLYIWVTHNGVTKLTVIDVDKYSAGPANVVATTEGQFDSALSSAATAVAVANTKYVIELNRASGFEWDPLRTIDMTVASGSQLIIRGAGGLSPVQRQRLNRCRLNVRGGHGLYIQNIDRVTRMNTAEWMSGVSRSTTQYIGTSTNTGPYRFFRSNAKGGVVRYSGINPDESYNPVKPQADWIAELFFFGASYPNSSTGGPITLQVYDPVTQTYSQSFTSASGTGYKTLTKPGFVGDNLPFGVLPNVTNWATDPTVGVPLEFKKQPWWSGGTDAVAYFKPEFLPANDPRAYAGAGNYVTEVFIANYGNGYSSRANQSDTFVSGAFYANQNCSWRTDPAVAGSARSLRSLANGETVADSTISPWIEWSECRYEDLGISIAVVVRSAAARRAMYRCLFDRFTLDVMAWGTSSDVGFTQGGGPLDPKIRVWGTIFGRCLSNSTDRTDPHVDIIQLFAQGDLFDIRYFVDWVRNVYDAGLNTRAGAQCIFMTDANTTPVGTLGDAFDGVFFGHLQRGGIKSFASTFTSATRIHRFLSLNGTFSVADKAFRNDKLGSHAFLSKVLANGIKKPKSQQYLEEDVSSLSLSSFPNRNTHAFLDTFQKAVEAFTPANGTPEFGRTPVDAMDQEIDWVGGGFDPDAIPVRFPYPQKVGVNQNSTVTFAARQLFYGVAAKQFVPEPGTEWRVGGVPNLNGELSSASAWTSAPGLIFPHQYFQVRKITGSGIMALAAASYTIGGYLSTARSYTKDSAGGLMVSNATTGSFMRSVNGSSVNPSPNAFRRWVVFGKVRVPFPNTTSGTLTLLRGSNTVQEPFWLYMFSDGRIRLRSGTSTEISISYDPETPPAPGSDYTFFLAFDYNIEARPADPITGVVPNGTTLPEDGAIQAYANFRPMTMLATGGFVDPVGETVPLRLNSNITLFGDEIGEERPIGWGLYHLGIWCDEGLTPLPDCSQWDVQRAFASEYLDGLTPGAQGNYPGRAIVDTFGPGLRLLVRGDLATVAASGLPNLAPAGTRVNMVPFVNEGAAWTGVILPTQPAFPGFTTFTGPSPAQVQSSTGDVTSWPATSALTLNPGERLIVGVASDSATNTVVVDPNSAGTWTRLGGAGGGDSSLDVFTCVNDGEEAITAQLLVTSNPAERLASLTYRAIPQSFGGRIAVQAAFGNTASNPPLLTLPGVRKAEWIVMRSRAGNATFQSTTPVDFGLSVQAANNPGQNTGTRLSGAQRQLEAASLDPGPWPEADAGGNCTIAVWEVLP